MKIHLAAQAVLVLLPFAVVAQEPNGAKLENAKPVIIVSGSGEVSGAPDMAEIDVGVVAEAESAKEAVDSNNQQMDQLISKLKELEIAGKDIQTSNFNVLPKYNQVRNGDIEPPRIVGYRVTNQVHVRIRKLKALGDVLDKVVVSGANQIQGIRFSIDKSEPLMDEAREKAIREAKRKGELMAQAAGVGLGQIVEIRENEGGSPPIPYRNMAMAQQSSSVPIEAGEQTLTARVLITFSISNPQ